MGDKAGDASLFDVPGQLLEHVTGLLAKVGIELPSLAVQAILLVLIVAVLIASRAKLWPPKAENAVTFPVGVALALAGLGILFSWVHELTAPLPDEVTGQVRAADLAGITVRVLDRNGENVSLSSGAVDGVSGEFVQRYRIEFGERPRALAVEKPGCKPASVALGRTELRNRTPITVNFACAPA